MLLVILYYEQRLPSHSSIIIFITIRINNTIASIIIAARASNIVPATDAPIIKPSVKVNSAIKIANTINLQQLLFLLL